MYRLLLIVAASAALAGAADATTDAGAAPAVASGFVATSNVEFVAQQSGLLDSNDMLFGNGRTSGFGLANEPGFSSANEPGFTNTGIPLRDRNDDGPLDAVPEPANWALLIAGFGLVGLVARRRRVAAAA